LAAAQRETLGRGQETGLLIVWVGHDTPAEQGGLMVGDILVAMDGRPVGDTDELQGILLTVGAGHEAQIQVLRGGKSVLLPVRVGEHA
ncbi:MAG TPA: PDZ domain-containing protein, partial [Chloroflexi bacterium]|nr:PDZ domain-containing protein [Chloroflexota bacterium]